MTQEVPFYISLSRRESTKLKEKIIYLKSDADSTTDDSGFRQYELYLNTSSSSCLTSSDSTVACSMHGRRRMQSKSWSKSLKGRTHLVDIEVDGRTTLSLIFKMYGVKVWTGFV